VEVVIRALVMFFFLWGVTRAVGRSTLGELSTFQLLLYVTMGDLVQQSVTQQDYSFTSGVLAVGVFALLTVVLSWTQWRFPRLSPVINGEPLVVVREGQPLERPMGRQRLSLNDLMVAARLQGIRRIQDVELAVLEADGRLSFFTRTADDSEDGSPDTQIAG
jgi:uncharacterized membrane protein YcaP (DUF421 family)